MANSLTEYGQNVALNEDDDRTGLAGSASNDGGLLQLATRIKLYDSTTVPGKTNAEAHGSTGTFAVNEVANGNGYTTNGQAITAGNWTKSVVGGNVQYQLADQQWTAAGGQIANIAGAFITDADGNVLAWWERGNTVTLNDGESITADDLVIRLG